MSSLFTWTTTQVLSSSIPLEAKGRGDEWEATRETTSIYKPLTSSYSFSLSFTSKFATTPAKASPAEVSSASSPFSNFRFSARPSSYAFWNAFATSSSLNLIAKNSSLVSPLKKRQKFRNGNNFEMGIGQKCTPGGSEQ